MAPAFPRGSFLSYNCPEIEFDRPAAAYNRRHRNNIYTYRSGLLLLDKSPSRSRLCHTLCGLLSAQGNMLQITSTRLVQVMDQDHLVIKFDFTLEAPARAETPEVRAGHVQQWPQNLALKALKNSGTSLAERRDGTDPLPPCYSHKRNTPPLTSSSWTTFPFVQNYLKAQPEGASASPTPLGRASPRPVGIAASSPAGSEPQGPLPGQHQTPARAVSLHLAMQSMALPTQHGPEDSLPKGCAERRSQNHRGISCSYRCSRHSQNDQH